jgi:hypothetical protein
MDVNMNIVKYDTNKRWVIHNLNQQKVSNLLLLEIFSFEEEVLSLTSKQGRRQHYVI